MTALDENKTALTHRVTATAAAYLDGLGCKPVETEVAIRRGWVADLASYWYPTMTEAKRLGLDRSAAESLGITDHTQIDDILLRVYGDGPFTVVVEVKTTPADFKRDRRKWECADWPAHICFIGYPAGVVRDYEIPRGWYGLETSKDGTKLRKVHRPTGRPHPQHSGLVIDFVAAVGIRRDHRTRHVAVRALAQRRRARDREREARYSAGHLLTGLANWLQHRGWKPERHLEAALADWGVKEIPKAWQPALAFFKALRAGRNEKQDA